ncbi:MAG: hypothetical protein JWN03_7001 [Nocardia sp.]|nr:hypothetical protein [Nocardia sp.]
MSRRASAGLGCAIPLRHKSARRPRPSKSSGRPRRPRPLGRLPRYRLAFSETTSRGLRAVGSHCLRGGHTQGPSHRTAHERHSARFQCISGPVRPAPIAGNSLAARNFSPCADGRSRSSSAGRAPFAQSRRRGFNSRLRDQSFPMYRPELGRSGCHCAAALPAASGSVLAGSISALCGAGSGGHRNTSSSATDGVRNSRVCRGRP